MERPRKTKISTRNSDTTSGSKGQGHQASLVGCSGHYILYMDDAIIITRASCCLSIMNNEYSGRKARCRRKAYRLWTGGGPQRAGWGISCGLAHSLLNVNEVQADKIKMPTANKEQ